MPTTPAFFWYPDDRGSLETLDLAGSLADLQVTPLRSRSSAMDGGGSPHFAVREGGYRVRIVRERALSASVVRGLESLQSHLYRGGRVGFARNQDKAWAGYYTTFHMNRGASTVYTAGHAFASWIAAPTLANGDEVVIESANPEYISEMRTITSISAGGDITLAENMDFTRQNIGMVRWRDFFPCLFLPDEGIGKPIYTHEHGLAYTLDVDLQLDPAILSSGGYDANKLTSLGGAGSPEQGGAADSLESIVTRSPAGIGKIRTIRDTVQTTIRVA